MKQNLIVTIRYKEDKPSNELFDKIVQLFDKSKKVDLLNDDYVTQLIEPNGIKSFSINMQYQEKDFKSAVFEILKRANKIAERWTIQGPIKTKTYFFLMDLENNEQNILPNGIIGYRIILNSEPK